jgi:SNF2 family DNA or RNA helicase
MRTYGQVQYLEDSNRWALTVEPHVAIKAKRYFSKMDTQKYKTLHLSATPENCRDLEHFLIRYPLEVDRMDLLLSRAQNHKDREEQFHNLLAGNYTPTTNLLKLPAREYQILAAEAWMLSKGLILGDEVGLGKTLSAIVGFNRPTLLPALVVTLTHLPGQWQKEIHRFTDLSTHILTKATPYDITKYFDGKMPDVVVGSYSKLHGWADVFGSGVFRSVVFDEVHELRNQGSKKYTAAKHIAGSVEYAQGLSATPIFNYGGEIYNVIDVVADGKLGTKEEFQREWCIPLSNGKHKLQDPQAFGTYLRDAGIMLRRTRKDVKRELPEVTVVPHHINADPGQLMKLQGDAIELARLILKEGPEDFKGQKMRARGDFDTKMRQATGVAKSPFVADFVNMLHEESQEKIVLYGWHHAVYSVWMERLKHLNPRLYTGEQSASQKEESKKAFVEGDCQVLIISLRSGAGLDGLQNVSNIAVFGELDWSPGVMHQCLGRIHRDGQDDPVVAYYLLSDQGSDPIMSDVLGLKLQQLTGITTPDKSMIEHHEVDPDHIRKLAEKFLYQHTAAMTPEVSQ